MKDEKINLLVKKLEPLFIGYKAEENCLKNSNGMELLFSISWNKKPTVSGLHASRSHSIGCSFEKSPEKIFKDIRKRLMPEYYEDFFMHKRHQLERKEAEDLNAQKLEAITSAIGGEIQKDYGYCYSGSAKFIRAENASIYEAYNDKYELRLQLDFMGIMKLAKYLKDYQFIETSEHKY